MTTAEALMSLCTARGVALDAVSRGGIPELTAADVALAARGLPRRPWLAALYSLAGDDTVGPSIRTWLLESLLGTREAMQWTSHCRSLSGARVRFAEPLVELFLREERSPARFRVAPGLRAIVMQVEPQEWSRVLVVQYQAVASEYARALTDAEEWLRRKSR